MTTLSDTVRVARKAHRCKLCFDPIDPGTRHNDYRGVWEGRAYTYRTHLGCAAVGIAYMRIYREDGFDRASVQEFLGDTPPHELLALPELVALDETERARAMAFGARERARVVSEMDDADGAEVQP